MGLDNGICIRRKTASPEALAAFDPDSQKAYEYDLDVAYWRKCWNVRSMVLHTLNVWQDNDSRTPMTLDDVVVIIRNLQKFNRKNYTEWGWTIWEWSDFRRINRRNIAALNRLVRLMKKNDNIEVYFYDSW